MTDRGLLIRGRDGNMVLNPAHRAASGLRDQLARYDAALGLSPRSRQSIHAEVQPDGDMDEIERALCGD